MNDPNEHLSREWFSWTKHPKTSASEGTALSESMRSELVAMDDHDQVVRAQLAADGSLFQGYHPRMAAVHDTNAGRLREIIREHGWPTIALVGLEGANAAHRPTRD